jgi:hypothetical protein
MNPTKRKLAELVREVAVRLCKDDGKLTRHCTECAIALAIVFSRAGFSDSYFIEGKWKNGQEHYWTESDGKYWDLTATQFDPDLPPVLVSSMDDPNYLGGQRARGPEAFRFRTHQQGPAIEIADEVTRLRIERDA